ncbi:DMT family transporter [Demetria terragena]|uniref:DMT family transporter n=1 Tax=Demetria terragena TaxID=63959 RepID=UPI0003688CB2|nr:DMT family transporter [Demetria terragena]
MESGSRTRTLSLLGAFACGALLALQSRINGTLSEQSGRPIMAALWSFGSGLVILTVLLFLMPRVRASVRDIPTAVRDGRLRWFQCLGGLIGGLFVAAQTFAVPLVGVAIFSVATLAGQTASGLGVDRLGWGSGGKHAVTRSRIGFALLGLLGVAVSATGRGGAAAIAVAPIVLAVLIGGAVAVQQSINSQVNHVVGQPLATTWQNFFFGMVILVVVALVTLVTQSGSWAFPSGAPWWSWLGALCGITFIAIMSWAVHEVGVLTFGLVSVAGQLLSALGLDLLTPSVRSSIEPALFIGVGISLLAALGAGLMSARRPSVAAARPEV